jgi:hypothetical protein
MSESQQKYLAEYEKYKNVIIIPGLYKTTEGIDIEIISINNETQTAETKTVKSGYERTRTLHWCRKHLIR